MSDSSLHLKLDRVLARLEDQGKRQDGFEDVLRILTEGLRGLTPLFAQQREMLALILNAATQEPAEGSELTEALSKIGAALNEQGDHLGKIVQVLQSLPDVVESAATDGIRLAMAEAEPAEPHGNGQAGPS